MSDWVSIILMRCRAEFEIDPDFQGRGRVEVEGQIFRVDESEIEGRRSRSKVEIFLK